MRFTLHSELRTYPSYGHRRCPYKGGISVYTSTCSVFHLSEDGRVPVACDYSVVCRHWELLLVQYGGRCGVLFMALRTCNDHDNDIVCPAALVMRLLLSRAGLLLVRV